MKKLKPMIRFIPLRSVYRELCKQWKLANDPQGKLLPSEINGYPELAVYFGPYLSECMSG